MPMPMPMPMPIYGVRWGFVLRVGKDRSQRKVLNVHYDNSFTRTTTIVKIRPFVKLQREKVSGPRCQVFVHCVGSESKNAHACMHACAQQIEMDGSIHAPSWNPVIGARDAIAIQYCIALHYAYCRLPDHQACEWRSSTLIAAISWHFSESQHLPKWR